MYLLQNGIVRKSFPGVPMPTPQKILILDPSPIFSSTLKEVIKTREPHVEVTETNSTAQAEAILEKEAVDVVFLDIAIPQDNGIQFISAIKRVAPEARIVVLSSHESTEYKEASIRNGANFFLSKERSGGLRLLDVIHEAVEGNR
jgi:DNA-binding NarL/FixJ family response regulator